MPVGHKAPGTTFALDVLASPLAATSYDLQHEGTFTWLARGVPSAKAAEWARHSVEVLHKVYAKFLDGHEEAARRWVEEALNAP